MPYGQLNLDMNFWSYFQRDCKASELVERIKTIVEDPNSGAVISKTILYHIGFDVSAESGAEWLSLQFSIHWHWCSVALAIMSRCYFVDNGDEVISFYKTEHVGKPYLPENIKKVDDSSCRWGKWVLKDSKPVKIEERPLQRSLFE
jgi:hypothetical protein